MIVDPATTIPFLSYFMNAFKASGESVTRGVGGRSSQHSVQHFVIGTLTQPGPSGCLVLSTRTVGIILLVLLYLTKAFNLGFKLAIT